VFWISSAAGIYVGIFAKPLAQEFHTNRGSIALAVSLLDVVLTLPRPAPGVWRIATGRGVSP